MSTLLVPDINNAATLATTTAVVDTTVTVVTTTSYLRDVLCYDRYDKSVSFRPGSMFAINIPAAMESIVTVPVGLSLTLSLAVRNRCKVYPDDDNGIGRLVYRIPDTLTEVAVSHFTLEQPTISGLGLTLDGPQSFSLLAECKNGSISVTGTIRRQIQQQQTQELQQQLTTRDDANERSICINYNNQPTTTTATSSVTAKDTVLLLANHAHKPSPVTERRVKRKLDAEALMDELTEMQCVDMDVPPHMDDQRRTTESGASASQDIAIRNTNSNTDRHPGNNHKRMKLTHNNTNNNTNQVTQSNRKNSSNNNNQVTQNNRTNSNSNNTNNNQVSQNNSNNTPLSRNARRKLAKQKTDELEVASQRFLKPLNSDTRSSVAPVPTKERRLKGGILIQDITIGKGPAIQPGRKVTIHYRGTFPDGTVFVETMSESNDTANAKPFEFRYQTGQVVQGLDQGMEGMRMGGKRQIVVPPDRAYGSKGSPPVIPPHATLIFVVQLLHPNGRGGM